MQKIPFLIFSLLYFPLSVLSVPNPDPDWDSGDQCFTVDEYGMVQIDDMWLLPEQLPPGLRKQFDDTRRGKNKILNMGGGDQCFTVDEQGYVIIGDMWLLPDQLPYGLRMNFDDCARRGLNKEAVTRN